MPVHVDDEREVKMELDARGDPRSRVEVMGVRTG